MKDSTNIIQDYITCFENNTPCETSLEDVLAIRAECAEQYYNTGDKIVSDGLYDKLTNIIRRIGVVPEVGAAPSSKELNLEQTFAELAGSLEDETDEAVIYEFFGKHKQTSMIQSYKGDGNSVTLEFNARTGKIIKAVTRGKNGVGVDLTSVFANRVLVPEILVDTDLDTDVIAVKCEAMLTYDNFKKYCTDNGKQLANPRSAISGILGKNDAHLYSKYISLAPLEIRHSNRDIKRVDQLNMISKMVSSDPTKLYHSLGHKIVNVSDFSKIVADAIKNRDKLPFMIDGLVVEILDEAIRHDLGWVGNYPKHSKAFKFPYAEYDTEVIDIEFDFGKSSGRFTPCVVFKTVTHKGCEYDRVSIANYKRFTELKLGKGSKILFTYNMDTLGYIDRKSDKFNDTVTPIPFITECPYCNSKLKINSNETFVNCVNEQCVGILKGRIENFLEGVGAKGIRAATIDKLFENKLITDVESIYHIDYSKVENITGLGKKSAKTIETTINKIRTLKDYQVLANMSIENVGSTTSLNVCRVIELKKLIEMSKADALNWFKTNKIQDVGDIISQNIVDGIDKYRDQLKKMYKNLTIESSMITRNTTKVLRIAVTGSITYPGARNGIKKLIEEKLGHKLVGSVGKDTDYLISNDQVAVNDKLTSARKHNTTIITEAEFLKMVEDKKV